MSASIQLDHNDAWILVGAPSSCSVSLASTLLVTWPDASVDTLAAHVAAATSGAVTQVDVRALVWLVYTVKGSGTLSLIAESDLPSIDGDTVGILCRVLDKRAVPYQPGSGGGGPVPEVAALEFVLDGGGSPLPTGVQGRLVVPFGCTLTSAELLADTSGSLVVDIWKSSYFGYPPSITNTITASTPLTLSTAQKTQDTVLTGWTTNFVLGDILVFDVVSCATITACSVILRVTT